MTEYERALKAAVLTTARIVAAETQFRTLAEHLRTQIAALQAAAPSTPAPQAEAPAAEENIDWTASMIALDINGATLEVQERIRDRIAKALRAASRRPRAPLPAVPKDLMDRLPSAGELDVHCDECWAIAVPVETAAALRDLLALLRAGAQKGDGG